MEVSKVMTPSHHPFLMGFSMKSTIQRFWGIAMTMETPRLSVRIRRLSRRIPCRNSCNMTILSTGFHQFPHHSGEQKRNRRTGHAQEGSPGKTQSVGGWYTFLDHFAPLQTLWKKLSWSAKNM